MSVNWSAWVVISAFVFLFAGLTVRAIRARRRSR